MGKRKSKSYYKWSKRSRMKKIRSFKIEKLLSPLKIDSNLYVDVQKIVKDCYKQLVDKTLDNINLKQQSEPCCRLD